MQFQLHFRIRGNRIHQIRTPSWAHYLSVYLHVPLGWWSEMLRFLSDWFFSIFWIFSVLGKHGREIKIRRSEWSTLCSRKLWRSRDHRAWASMILDFSLCRSLHHRLSRHIRIHESSQREKNSYYKYPFAYRYRYMRCLIFFHHFFTGHNDRSR